MLTKILEIRTVAVDLYRRGRVVINPVIKFILALLVFSSINSAIGFDPRFARTSIVLVLSLVSAVTPGGVMVLLAMLLSLLHLYSSSLLLAAIVFMFYIVLYAALMRFSSKYALAAVIVPLLAPFNLHFAVPLVLGCVATPVAILPCTCGVVLYYLIDIIKVAAQKQVELNIDDVVQYYTDIFDVILAQKEMYIVIIVFAVVLAVVFVIRRLPFNYSFLISVGVGTIVNIIGLLIGSLKSDLSVSVGAIIFMSLLCGVITIVADYIKRVLDYTAIEHLQFEDDDYYYYVKAVPKINISMTNHSIRVLNVDDSEPGYEEDAGYYDGSGYDEGLGYDDGSEDYDDASGYGQEPLYDDISEPGFDMYDEHGDLVRKGSTAETDDEVNLAMQYAMSDVEADFEEEMDFDDKN